MSKVDSVGNEHEDPAVSVVGAEGHVCIQEVVDVGGLRPGILDEGSIHKVRTADERHVPKTPGNIKLFSKNTIDE